MLTKPDPKHISAVSLQSSPAAAARAIPPAWPLASSVAVNPYLGQIHDSLTQTAARLERVAGAPVTMPRSWYHAKIMANEVTEADLSAALAAASDAPATLDLPSLKAAAARPHEPSGPLPTIADLAAEVSGIDWPGLIAQRLGAWSADYFDAGQALWAAPKGKNAYGAWRAVALHDLTPEIAGLSGFATHVADAPETATSALLEAADALSLTDAMLETYFHRLLVSLGGWAQCARYKLWQAELEGGSDSTLTDFLAIRLIWETALLDRFKDRIDARWQDARSKYAVPLAPSEDQIINTILQDATERSAQRAMMATLAASATPRAATRPKLQAVFCIDVRSEVFRRALEAVDPGIRTHGFAGFFGLATSHRQFASDVEERRFPVLLNPGVHSCAAKNGASANEEHTRLTARAKRAWGRFKLAAVSSFAFVEATGPVYAAELLRDALGLAKPHTPGGTAPRFDPPLDLATRASIAATVLRAMSLTEGFAPVVLLAGHGASVTNNPYASALNCGACGGHSGEVNARLLAGLLNDADVRAELAKENIAIPDDTVFIGALHDTTTDDVMLYADDDARQRGRVELHDIRAWLMAARKTTCGERALRLPHADGADGVAQRSSDWSEIRPEWALAGCKAFIAAPRKRTAGKNLEGRAFLHDYDWQKDDGFGVLELIMTAPVVVASWISLQYYGSTVSPGVFGAGNKLLHNVTGGIGVVEGNGGLLRAGLPWQSVHDGEKLVHEPLRLTVLIEAPVDAMNDVLEKHTDVRALFDNRWLYLMAIDGDGRVHARYAGGLEWDRVTPNVDSE